MQLEESIARPFGEWMDEPFSCFSFQLWQRFFPLDMCGLKKNPRKESENYKQCQDKNISRKWFSKSPPYNFNGWSPQEYWLLVLGEGLYSQWNIAMPSTFYLKDFRHWLFFFVPFIDCFCYFFYCLNYMVIILFLLWHYDFCFMAQDFL